MIVGLAFVSNALFNFLVALLVAKFLGPAEYGLFAIAWAGAVLVNTAGFRFNAPTPVTIGNFVQRVDVNLNDKMKIFGRGTFTRRNDEWGVIQFPGDPQ